jgi:hypothetical protein
MKLLDRLYVATTSDKIALMRWPERPWSEMDDIANAIINVECGIASVPYNQVGLPGRFFSILWSREIVVERLSARNAFAQPLAWGVGRLFVSTGSSVITYNLNSKGQDYTLDSRRQMDRLACSHGLQSDSTGPRQS